MDKRGIVALAVMIAILLLLICVPSIKAAGGVRLAGLMATPQTFEQITSTHQQATLNFSIWFNGAKLFLDETAGRFYYSVTDGDYDPEVTLGGADGCEIRFLQSEISSRMVSENTAVPFVIYNNRFFHRYELVLTTLPLMSIDTEHDISQSDTRALIQLYDNAGSQGVQSNAVIHIRGGSSQGYPKKGYRLSLKARDDTPRHLPLLGMRNDDDWILYAAYNEPEKLRSALAYALWQDIGADGNSFGINFGPECRFVELFVNGAYAGLYLLMTPVDAKQINLEKSDDPARCEYLYRSINYEATDSADFHASANASVAGKFELREPGDTGSTYLKWKPLDELNKLVEYGGDAEFSEKLFTMTELDNISDYWIFINTVYAEDNVEKNINLAAKYRDGRYTIVFGAWDVDLTFGNVYTEEAVLCCRIDPLLADADLWNSALMQRALAMDAGGIRAHIAGRWEELRSGVLSDGAVFALLDALKKDVYDSGAILRDHERWPEAAFTSAPSALAEFISERLQHMDHYVYQLSAGQK